MIVKIINYFNYKLNFIAWLSPILLLREYRRLRRGFPPALHVLPHHRDHVGPAAQRVREPRQVLDLEPRQIAEALARRLTGTERRHLDVRGAAGLAGATEVIDEALPHRVT